MAHILLAIMLLAAQGNETITAMRHRAHGSSAPFVGHNGFIAQPNNAFVAQGNNALVAQ
jgi:hypothetical protein